MDDANRNCTDLFDLICEVLIGEEPVCTVEALERAISTLHSLGWQSQCDSECRDHPLVAVAMSNVGAANAGID